MTLLVNAKLYFFLIQWIGLYKSIIGCCTRSWFPPPPTKFGATSTTMYPPLAQASQTPEFCDTVLSYQQCWQRFTLAHSRINYCSNIEEPSSHQLWGHRLVIIAAGIAIVPHLNWHYSLEWLFHGFLLTHHCLLYIRHRGRASGLKSSQFCLKLQTNLNL